MARPVSQTSKSQSLNQSRNQPRGEAARSKLLQAGLELFGELGFDGASTRDIANKAGQNIGAISYYFGNKEGLYGAVLGNCLCHKKQQIDPKAQAIQELLARNDASPEAYLEAMKHIVHTGVMGLTKEDRETRNFMKLMFREQFAPTKIFKRLFRTHFLPENDPFTCLMVKYLGTDLSDVKTILTAHALIGPYIAFRVAPEMVRLKAGWKNIDEKQAAIIASILTEQLEITLTGLRKSRLRETS